MRLLLLLIFLSFNNTHFAHEGHHENAVATTVQNQENSTEASQEKKSSSWTQWIGSYHLILLHFPIALINMVAISDVLWIRYRKPIFDYSSRFMILSAALLAPPTAILGWIYSYSFPYEGPMRIFLLWHMGFGISATLLAVITALIREKMGQCKLYYTCLVILVILIIFTCFYGGKMTFGS